MKIRDRKGFTLVELLAVIVLMAVLITVAVPGITRIGRSLKVQSYCSKIKIIESAALEYANDYYADKEITNTNSIDNVSLMDLINMGYLKGDNDIKTTLTAAEREDQAKGKKFCLLYNKDSACLVDPRDDTSMDYKLVKIWLANKRLYASYRYNRSDADNKICGDDITYQREVANDSFNKNVTYTLNDTINAKKPMENSSYGWSNYKSYRTIRKDEIPGDYYINKVIVNYEVGTKTILELKSGDLFDITRTNGNTYTISGNHQYSDSNLPNQHLGNIDITYRVALNSTTRSGKAYGKITSVVVEWKKIN